TVEQMQNFFESGREAISLSETVLAQFLERLTINLIRRRRRNVPQPTGENLVRFTAPHLAHRGEQGVQRKFDLFEHHVFPPLSRGATSASRRSPAVLVSRCRHQRCHQGQDSGGRPRPSSPCPLP